MWRAFPLLPHRARLQCPRTTRSCSFLTCCLPQNDLLPPSPTVAGSPTCLGGNPEDIVHGVVMALFNHGRLQRHGLSDGRPGLSQVEEVYQPVVGPANKVVRALRTDIIVAARGGGDEHTAPNIKYTVQEKPSELKNCWPTHGDLHALTQTSVRHLACPDQSALTKLFSFSAPSSPWG